LALLSVLAGAILVFGACYGLALALGAAFGALDRGDPIVPSPTAVHDSVTFLCPVCRLAVVRTFYASTGQMCDAPPGWRVATLVGQNCATGVMRSVSVALCSDVCAKVFERRPELQAEGDQLVRDPAWAPVIQAPSGLIVPS
jgi:hypothetical protein